MPTALISVFNKQGIGEFAKGLAEQGWTIYASGGTAKDLKLAKVPVKDVAGLVGGKAILGHRVVTLSREIYAGLLATDSAADIAELKKLKIPRIDLVCVDLYPLQREISKPSSDEDSVIEQTDIGGPTLLRAAAKGRRVVICKPAQRRQVLEWIKLGMPNKDNYLRRLAAAAEAMVANYALISASYHSQGEYDGRIRRKVTQAAYGENPWQGRANLYINDDQTDNLAIAKFNLVQGSPPSYNNYADVDRLLQTMTHIAAAYEKNYKKVPYIALGAKHGNVCGAAVGSSQAKVLQQMLEGDLRAIFGGVVMMNFELNDKLAEILLTYKAAPAPRRLLDGVVAPNFAKSAIGQLERKGDKCRLLANKALAKLSQKSLDSAIRVRYIRGGLLSQDNYTYILNLKDAELAKHGKLTLAQEKDLILGWAIGSTSNSNTVTLVKDGQLIGNGVGQQDRVSAAELAIKRAKDARHDIKGAVAYSDSFFPFPDGPLALAKVGVKGILASSGSVNDGKIVESCKQANASLYLIPDKKARGFYAH